MSPRKSKAIGSSSSLPDSESDTSLEDGAIKPLYAGMQLPVTIPPTFLTTSPSDARPITYRPVDFSQTPLPEHQGKYAAILENVLSPSECDTLLAMAQSSVGDRGKSGDTIWRPALVRWGDGYEIMDKEYRNSDRIVWDCQEIMDRLWARMATLTELKAELAEVEEQGKKGVKRWKFNRVNERGRFLRYTGGQYFRPHCDGAFSEKISDTVYRSFYTIHLYLNDSVVEADQAGESGPAPDLVGGATSFLSADETRTFNVNPKAGRVLLFQHDGLYHSGDDVVNGTKYTMRTDVMFELQRDAVV